jgi:hypothetical protein
MGAVLTATARKQTLRTSTSTSTIDVVAFFPSGDISLVLQWYGMIYGGTGKRVDT